MERFLRFAAVVRNPHPSSLVAAEITVREKGQAFTVRVG